MSLSPPVHIDDEGIQHLPSIPIHRYATHDSKSVSLASDEKPIDHDVDHGLPAHPYLHPEELGIPRGIETTIADLPVEEDDKDDGYFKGKRKDPIITTGEDISRYAISIRDDHDPALTFRSILLGTIVAGLGAALSQIYIFKPIDVVVSPVFLLLFIYAIGSLWARILPTGEGWIGEEVHEHDVVRDDTGRGRRPFREMIGRWMRFINPGKFGLKEHVVSTLIATTASNGSSAVNNFAVQHLFYNTGISPTTAILATFSTACFGYGLVGILRPLSVYPAEMVYWTNLPNVLTLQALHFDHTASSKRLKLFWVALTSMAIWEIFPQYIFPLLNGLSLPCLVSQSSPLPIRHTISHLFGGAEGNEGLGFAELSLDWQYIGSSYLSLPLIQQANSWFGFAVCYIAIVAIYYSNVWDSRTLPLLSTSIFSEDSTPSNPIIYNQTFVFGPSFTLNDTALAEEGLPLLTGSYVWSLMASNWAIGALFAHVLLFWWPQIKASLPPSFSFSPLKRNAFFPPTNATTADAISEETPSKELESDSDKISLPSRPQPLPSVRRSSLNPRNTPPVYQAYTTDRHYLAMQRYKEAPWWWYLILLVISFFAGLIVVLKGGTTLPVWGYILALALGAFIAPFSGILFARMGNGIATNQLMKMVAGAVHPGKPVANLYFSMWSHDVIATSILLAGDLKMGQYLKIPPRVMFLTQVWGTILGAIVNYVVMISIVTSQREILLSPQGTNVWSGADVQSLNSQAVTWSLASHMFGIHSKYVWVPLGLVFGAVPTIIQYFIWRRWPKIGPIETDKILLPLIYQYAQWMTAGVTSVITTTIIVGVLSQVWVRRRHPRWFRKYLYIFGGALDGGTQIMVFILSFAVFGASGKPRPFPNWWGNPSTEVNNIDYCVQT